VTGLLLVVPLVLSVVLGVFGPALAARSGPALTARLGPLTCVVVAGSTLASLAAVAVVAIARIDEVASYAKLSLRSVLSGWSAAPGWVGVALAAVVTALMGLVAYRVVTLGRTAVAGQHMCRTLRRSAAGIHVLEDDRPAAFAVAGLRDRVVISTGLMRCLTPLEQSVVIAHERAHLRRRHHLSLSAMTIAVAADPLLAPMSAVVARAVEREADEDAAAVVGNRRLVGLALARAGLATAGAARSAAGGRAAGSLASPDHDGHPAIGSGSGHLASPDHGGHPATGSGHLASPDYDGHLASVGGGGHLAIAGGDVPCRVEALLAPPAPVRAWAPALLATTALLSAWATGVAVLATDHHLDRARWVYQAAGRASTAHPPTHSLSS